MFDLGDPKANAAVIGAVVASITSLFGFLYTSKYSTKRNNKTIESQFALNKKQSENDFLKLEKEIQQNNRLILLEKYEKAMHIVLKISTYLEDTNIAEAIESLNRIQDLSDNYKSAKDLSAELTSLSILYFESSERDCYAISAQINNFRSTLKLCIQYHDAKNPENANDQIAIAHGFVNESERLIANIKYELKSKTMEVFKSINS